MHVRTRGLSRLSYARSICFEQEAFRFDEDGPVSELGRVSSWEAPARTGRAVRCSMRLGVACLVPTWSKPSLLATAIRFIGLSVCVHGKSARSRRTFRSAHGRQPGGGLSCRRHAHCVPRYLPQLGTRAGSTGLTRPRSRAWLETSPTTPRRHAGNVSNEPANDAARDHRHPRRGRGRYCLVSASGDAGRGDRGRL